MHPAKVCTVGVQPSDTRDGAEPSPCLRPGLVGGIRRDYSMPGIVVFSGSMAWCKKLSFYDPTSQRRLTFKTNDFVRQIGDDHNSPAILRIDQIFVHRFQLQSRLFIKVTRVRSGFIGDDPVLGVTPSRDYCQPLILVAPLFQSTGAQVIGLIWDAN